MHRRTALKVQGGRALRKNNWASTGDAVFLAGTAVAFERRRPGEGYKHLLRKIDLERFIALLPDWDELAHGLQLIVLDAGTFDYDGWHRDNGTIALPAWERELWIDHSREFIHEHRVVLGRLGVEIDRPRDGYATVRWTESTARAYQLLHVFLHELGHHHDQMTTRSRNTAARGETYAETYATRYADQIWGAYEAEFGWLAH
jgi:hypothetical protein